MPFDITMLIAPLAGFISAIFAGLILGALPVKQLEHAERALDTAAKLRKLGPTPVARAVATEPCGHNTEAEATEKEKLQQQIDALERAARIQVEKYTDATSGKGSYVLGWGGLVLGVCAMLAASQTWVGETNPIAILVVGYVTAVISVVLLARTISHKRIAKRAGV